ncbi:BEN domain-containing protein [Caenorhabditis elegans]|uniref:BEN domain-containing protein n=1 Tax=Caenorhabditis elegans TaxID=6239 RepID=Q21772_CAEEL|nr:BEN domain-containing protein [Caenorhabditis elegans]CAA95841.2 BEN domain-containing protein [Caenorhabditis elegans]|eukprot:NP_492044.2 Uncharacterized protein CELE_R06C7.2 [Caenorhabditis elegans]
MFSAVHPDSRRDCKKYRYSQTSHQNYWFLKYSEFNLLGKRKIKGNFLHLFHAEEKVLFQSVMLKDQTAKTEKRTQEITCQLSKLANFEENNRKKLQDTERENKKLRNLINSLELKLENLPLQILFFLISENDELLERVFHFHCATFTKLSDFQLLFFPTPMYVANEYAKSGRNLWNEAIIADAIPEVSGPEAARMKQITDSIKYKESGFLIDRRVNASALIIQSNCSIFNSNF